MTPGRKSVRAVIALLLAAAVSSATDSLIIGAVDLVQLPAFDTIPGAAGQPFYEALNRSYRIANRLNAGTRPAVLRREILFAPGETLRPALLSETARNLRRLGVVGDVSVRADTVADTTVTVTVYTREKWTKLLEGEFRQDGGVRSLYLGIKDNNFLGTIRSIGVGYNYATDRDDPHGFAFSFADERLVGSRWSLEAAFKESEENQERTVRLTRPFRTEKDPWSAGLLFGAVPRRRGYYYHPDSDSVTEGYRNFMRQSIWLSRMSGSTHKLYTGAALLLKRTGSGTLPVQPFENYDLAALSAGYVRRTYHEERFIDGYGRTEDMSAGYAVNISAGRNFGFTEAESFDYCASAEIRAAGRAGRGVYGAAYASIASFLRADGWSESTFRAGGRGYVRLPFRQTLAGRVITGRGLKWNDTRYFALDSPSGLRGYPVNTLAGSRMLLINMENRSAAVLRIWFFNAAPVLFADAGTVWDSDDRLADRRLSWSVGAGMRLENTKQQGAGITRLDVAYNPEEGDVALIITTGQLFRAVSGLGAYGPASVFE